MKQVQMIIDLDLATDPGDAGALSMAHALMDQGFINILAVCCAGTYEYAPGCADAFNKYHGRWNTPVGVNKGPAVEPGPDPEIYNKFITENFSNKFPSKTDAPDAISVYRQVLVAAADNSVVICTLGQLANVAHLYDSPADGISPLTGQQLMEQKVKRLVSMAGDYPTGFEYNIFTDWTSAKNVFENFNGRIEYLGYTVGLSVKTGQSIIDTGNLSNPLYWAYRLFKDVNPTQVPRESWDQMGLWLAAFGGSHYCIRWFDFTGGGSNTVASDGTNTWVSSPVKNQAYVNLVGNPAMMAEIIDDWQDTL